MTKLTAHGGRLVLGAILVGAAGGCAQAVNSASKQPATRTVHMKNLRGHNPFGFVPQTLVITVGTKVVWSNTSSAPHTVTASGEYPYFNSGTQKLIKPQHQWSFTFRKTGTFHYYCIVHPFMHGTVIVRARS